ncbi:hypothetical protein EON73_01635 [bacterium]|nr:MAG: hypothetical protein EON73_01635 [bacterium]
MANTLDLDFMEIDTTAEDLKFMEIDETKAETQDFVFVDVQGFVARKNHLICKEFCLVSDDDKFHAIVKSPYRFGRLPEYYRRQAEWLTRFHHGLAYDSGDFDLIDLLQTVYPKLIGKKIIVKGAQKIDWLKYMFRNCGEIDCVNIEDMGYCKSLHENVNVHDFCDYHHCKRWRKWHCAMENALKLQEIVKNMEIV